jgi:hypothetical protein
MEKEIPDWLKAAYNTLRISAVEASNREPTQPVKQDAVAITDKYEKYIESLGVTRILQDVKVLLEAPGGRKLDLHQIEKSNNFLKQSLTEVVEGSQANDQDGPRSYNWEREVFTIGIDSKGLFAHLMFPRDPKDYLAMKYLEKPESLNEDLLKTLINKYLVEQIPQAERRIQEYFQNWKPPIGGY